MLRCPDCRTRRATFTSMVRHLTQTQHRVCTCGGYWYPHRPGSPCCEGNPRALVNRAVREGYDPLAAVADWAYDTPGTTGPDCPF
jgi:hypothetical protein